MEPSPTNPETPAPAAQPVPAQPARAIQPAPLPEEEYEVEEEQPRRRRRGLQIMPAFWTISSLVSMIVNIILIVLLISLGTQLFTLKKLVQDQLLGGLYENFVKMDQAHIMTTIPVSAKVPAKFNLPLKTNTVVVLTEDTLLKNATIVSLQTGNMTMYNTPATIKLAAGTELPVALDLSVPVDQMIPVNLNVQVDIPLSQTELHQPFAGLQEVVRPYYKMLAETPGSWDEIFCAPDGMLLMFCSQGQ